MYNYLVQHPEVRRPLTKEVHYFDVHFSRGPAWYRSNFPIRAKKGERWITGEATPAYLFHPKVPERVAACVADARFLVLLRNPADRAYSHYQHERAKGVERLTFEEALEAEPARIEGELERQASEDDYFSYNLRHFAYRQRGLYSEQLERWLAFFPVDQFLVLQSERLFSDPEPALRRVLDFLQLGDFGSEHFPTLNERNYEPMDVGVRAQLAEYYRLHNQTLFQLLGSSFDWE
jgi:hypothetical protein